MPCFIDPHGRPAPFLTEISWVWGQGGGGEKKWEEHGGETAVEM